MKIDVNESVYLSDITPSDKAAYVKHFQECEIADQTMQIPYPYTEEDADAWIHRVAEETKRQGQPVCWAIRRKQDGFLMGGVGFHEFEIGKSHKAILGYWLAKPYWNRGIMTDVVKTICQFAFKNFGLIRISADVFDFNVASARVLEKVGFQFEGLLRKYHLKDGKLIDCKLYGLVRE